MASSAASTSVRPVTETLKMCGRALAGGLLFAVASMYTMEIWWQGYTVSPVIVLVTFLVTLFVLTAFAHYAGMSDEKTLLSDVIEGTQSITLGFLATWIVLNLAGQLSFEMSAAEYVARIIMVGVSGAIGVAVGTTQLGSDPDEESGKEEKEKGNVGHELTLSALGAVLIGISVAATEEVLLIAVGASPWESLALALLSFVIALGVVSYTNFKGSAADDEDGVFAGGPLGDAFVTYAVALLVSAAMLWSAGRFGGMAIGPMIHLTVYLGLPCALGASAGRMLL